MIGKTLEQAIVLIGEAHCPVILKSESDALEAAVCLKKTPSGYLLGVSDKNHELCFFFGTSLLEAKQLYVQYQAVMQKTGSPFA